MIGGLIDHTSMNQSKTAHAHSSDFHVDGPDQPKSHCYAYEACGRAEQATQEVRLGKQEIQRLAQNLEHMEMHCELEKHRKMEALRQEHAQQLKCEHCQWERDRERADVWLEEIKSRFESEKMKYEIRIQSLESELALTKQRYSPERELEHSSEEGGPDLHLHPESLPRPQLGTKQLCLDLVALLLSLVKSIMMLLNIMALLTTVIILCLAMFNCNQWLADKILFNYLTCLHRV